MNDRVFSYPFGDIYRLYIAKVERKGHNSGEVDQVIVWLTGYTPEQLHTLAVGETTLQEFFDQAPQLNPNRALITGSICGYKVQDIKDPLMQLIRYMDKLVDEVAKGKAMEKILRTATGK